MWPRSQTDRSPGPRDSIWFRELQSPVINLCSHVREWGRLSEGWDASDMIEPVHHGDGGATMFHVKRGRLRRRPAELLENKAWMRMKDDRTTNRALAQLQASARAQALARIVRGLVRVVAQVQAPVPHEARPHRRLHGNSAEDWGPSFHPPRRSRSARQRLRWLEQLR